MRRLILLSLISLMGCSKTIEYVYIVPEVDAETRTPCAVSDRKVKTANELAALATEHLNTALCANSKIETFDKVLAAAESKAGPK